MGEGCGFYSHKTFLHTLEEHLPGEAIGEVYAWGKVCPYECGYRSQFIQLSGIFDISGVDNTDSDYWATFADIYDVPLLTSPVEDYAQIIEIARWERCGWGMYGAMPLCEDPPEINLARAEELILNGEWPENE